MPNAGSRMSKPGTVGLRPSPVTTRISPSRASCCADDRSVDLDLVAFRGEHEAVADLDVRHDDAVLPREFPAKLGDSQAEFVLGREKLDGELLAERTSSISTVFKDSLIEIAASACALTSASFSLASTALTASARRRGMA